MKLATPPEERNHSYRGSGRGRGRGYAARGLAAAGLTRGSSRPNGESAPTPTGEN